MGRRDSAVRTSKPATAHATILTLVRVGASEVRAEAITIATVLAAESQPGGRAWTCGEGGIGAEHGHAGAVLGAAERHHVLANVRSDHLAALRVCVGEDVLDEVVAKLIAGDVDKWHTWALGVSFADDVEVAVEEVGATNLKTLLNNLGGELIHAVFGSEADDVVGGASTIGDGAMLAEVLNAPVAELTVSNDVDACEDLVDAWTLVFFKTVLKDVLDDEAAGLTQCNFVPHAAQSLVDVLHDLRWRPAPAQFKELLPDMTSVAVDDGLRDATKQLVHHDRLVLLRDGVEGLLDDMTPESIHAEVECVSANGLRNCNDLLCRAMLEAALDEEVAEAIDHERIRLVDNSADDLELLLRSGDLELLLQEDGGLLVVAADDLVDNVLPVAAHVTVEKAAVVERLHRVDVRGGLGRSCVPWPLAVVWKVRGSW